MAYVKAPPAPNQRLSAVASDLDLPEFSGPALLTKLPLPVLIPNWVQILRGGVRLNLDTAGLPVAMAHLADAVDVSYLAGDVRAFGSDRRG